MINFERIVIVGGPRRGKSYLANELSLNKVLIYCGDPLSKVKSPMPFVNYLPEDIPFSGDNGASQWIVNNWFTYSGPWICEGHVMARALRRWMFLVINNTNDENNKCNINHYPCDKIIVLNRPGFGILTPGQERMHTGVMTVWKEIVNYYESITEYIKDSSQEFNDCYKIDNEEFEINKIYD